MAGGEAVCRRSGWLAGGAVVPAAWQRGRRTRQIWSRLITDIRQREKVLRSDHSISLVTHGVQHIHHVPYDDAVRFMSCSDRARGFLSVHHSGHVRFYHPDGHLRDSALHLSLSVTYEGLTHTQLPDRLVAWGSGPTLTLLDSQLTPLMHAVDPLDIRVCQVVEGSEELVSAGAGNVCVWCLGHMLCRVRVLEGFGTDAVFTLLTVAPAAADKGPRALAVSGRAVTVVDLTEGRVLEHRTNLHLREITGLVYCPLQGAVVTASKDVSIRVWGPQWELLMAFVGHTALITSLLLCPVSGLLLSSSLDGTLRCWNLHTGDQVQAVSVPTGADPPLTMGGPSCSGSFFSFSRTGLDFWTFNKLYELHCRLGGDMSGPVRQILAPPTQPPYPVRILCVQGDSDVTLIAAEKGAVLTAFRANGRVRCADYCLSKEVLLVLTEEGAVTRANTLTNPVTLLDEQRADWTSGKQQVEPGPACCMALFSNITDPERALEEWRSLQQQKGLKMRRRKLQEDDKNRFLIMLGHRGGWISVMQMHSGKILYGVSAHSGQDVCSIQAHPDTSCVLTAGEDNSVLLWKVFPHAQECVNLQMSVFCAHTPVHVALLDSLLTIGLQQQKSATYSLVQYNLKTHSRTDHSPVHDHSSTITGLCACPKLRVFASCSRDGTVRIWDEENRLVRTLELNAEPECVEFSGERGELLVGIRGDLYRIPCTHALPQHLQLQLLCNDELSESVPDPLLSCSSACKHRAPVSEVDCPEKQDVTRDPELECLLLRNRDLRSLQSGETLSKTRKTASTAQTRREAFTRYMQLLYNQPVHINIPDDDPFDLDAALFPPKPPKLRPLTPPTIREGFFSNRSLVRKLDRTHTQESGPDPRSQAPPGFIPNSVLVGKLWPGVVVENIVPPKLWKLRDDLGLESEESEVDEVQCFICEEEEFVMPPVERVETPPKPPSPLPPPPPREKVKYTLKPLPPIKQASPPKLPSPPKTPTPPPSPPKPATPPPPRAPSPRLPFFLQQFLGEPWFHGIYSDQRCIPESLSPAEFCGQLLDFLKCCSVDQKLRVLKAIITLHGENLLNTQLITHGLLTSLRACLHHNMSDEEQRFVEELLNFLVCVNPHSFELAVELLSLLADKQLGLQGLAVCMLQVLGVDDTQHWLPPQLELLDSEARKQPNPQAALREAAGQWLHSWTDEYRVHKRLELPEGPGGKSAVSPVEVLRYFCWLRREGQVQPKKTRPEGRRDTVLLDTQAYRWKAVQRLGETYSMARIREPRELWLPPLPSRPLLMGFTRLLSLPLARISLSPFPLSLDSHCLKEPSPRRYFLLERSYVQYYR
ncbi:hypothetical protein MHYP_G00015770 [Metynnis hypsauchen]